MNTSTELQEKIKAECMKWYARGIQEFSQQPELLEILFDLSGQKAGIATVRNSGANTLNFNMILAEENEEEFLSQVVPHEVAHIIANKFYKQNCGHDVLWQSVMIKWGKDPKRCHHFSVENSSQSRRNYHWKCSKCGTEFHVGKNLHEKIQNNYHKYACSKCRQKYTLVVVQKSYDFLSEL